MGSIGQNAGQVNVIENVTAEDIILHHTVWAGRLKTWTGVQTGYPPNGGGAGLGYARNITFRRLELHNVERGEHWQRPSSDLTPADSW